MIKYPVIIILIAVVCYSIIENTDVMTQGQTIPEIKNLTSLYNTELQDTVYTLKQNYVVVNLTKQKAYLYSKTEPVYEFGVSSGNKKLLDAVETNEGLFVIQSKLTKWHSRQFDSTLMLNWMGFNHGIGFHALEGNSYYKYLGVRKSSHGCLRISREDAGYLYDRIEIGTPVLLHNENNAVSIGFADSSDIKTYQNYSYTNLFKILPERFNKLYEGRYFIEPLKKVLIGKHNIFHDGLPIGEAKNIPEKQLALPGSFETYYAVKDVLRGVNLEL